MGILRLSNVGLPQDSVEPYSDVCHPESETLDTFCVDATNYLTSKAADYPRTHPAYAGKHHNLDCQVTDTACSDARTHTLHTC